MHPGGMAVVADFGKIQHICILIQSEIASLRLLLQFKNLIIKKNIMFFIFMKLYTIHLHHHRTTAYLTNGTALTLVIHKEHDDT